MASAAPRPVVGFELASAGPPATPTGPPWDSRWARDCREVVDLKDVEPYHGETGTLKGTVRIEGDPPPDTGLRFPVKCDESQAMYGKVFRVGPENALADALVAVTGYKASSRAGEAVKATLRGCALSRRTYAGTFGQRLEVSNLDTTVREVHIPVLEGSSDPQVMVAVPGGSPIRLYPTIPSASHYVIRDQLRGGFFADVYILRYATVDVRGSTATTR